LGIIIKEDTMPFPFFTAVCLGMITLAAPANSTIWGSPNLYRAWVEELNRFQKEIFGLGIRDMTTEEAITTLSSHGYECSWLEDPVPSQHSAVEYEVSCLKREWRGCSFTYYVGLAAGRYEGISVSPYLEYTCGSTPEYAAPAEN
jgi:hypothetical protein